MALDMGEAENTVNDLPVTRVYVTAAELESYDKERFLQQWMKQECYIDLIESKLSASQTGEWVTGLCLFISFLKFVLILQRQHYLRENGRTSCVSLSLSLHAERVSISCD